MKSLVPYNNEMSGLHTRSTAAAVYIPLWCWYHLSGLLLLHGIFRVDGQECRTLRRQDYDNSDDLVALFNI